MFASRLIARLLALAFLAASPAVAADVVHIADPANAAVGAPLESDDVKRWIGSLDALRSWGEANEGRFDRNLFKAEAPRMNPMNPLSMDALQKMRSPFSGAIAAARVAGVQDELVGLLAPHGFTIDDWGNTGDRIIRAFVASQMQGGPDIRAQLNQTIAQMEENTRMSVGQKNQMISSLMQTLDIYNMMSDAPDADIQVVRPLAGLLQQTLER